MLGSCGYLYCIVRGYEARAANPGITLPSGFTLPPGAKMELQKTSVLSAPNVFNTLATVAPGREGVLFQVSIGLQTSPPWGTQSPEVILAWA